MMPNTHSLRLAKSGANAAELILYGVIDRWGDIDPKAVRDELKSLGKVDVLNVHINSEGGSIFAGLALYNTLRAHDATTIVHVDGIALSMASVIAMAGDEIVMAEGAMMMIHNPLWVAAGEAEELRQAADIMGKLKDQLVAIYARRTGKPAEEISGWMDAETWFTAEEAIAAGFANRTEARMAIAAALDPAKFQNLPEHLRQSSVNISSQVEEPSMAETNTNTAPQPAAYAELKSAFPKATADFLTSQLDAQATLEQARAAWQRNLEERAAAAEARLTELQAKADEAAKAAAAKKPIGSAGLNDSGEATNADAGDFAALVDAKVAQGMPRHLAARKVAKENPAAREAYVAAYNAVHKLSQR